MAKQHRSKIFSVLTILCLSLTSPLFAIHNSQAQGTPDTKKDFFQSVEWHRDVASALLQLGINAKVAKSVKEEKFVVSWLTLLLKDPDKIVRSRSASGLGEMGKTAQSALPALIEALKDQDEDVRQAVIESLGKIGTPTKPIVTVLIATLKDPSKHVRKEAVSALGDLGEPAKSAVPELIKIIKQSDTELRSSAAFALGQIGFRVQAAKPALIAILKAPDSSVRADALDGVSSSLDLTLSSSTIEFRKASVRELVPILINLLRDQNANVRDDATKLLGITEQKAAIPELINLLNDPNKSVRSSAVYALKEMGSPGLEAVPALVTKLKDSDHEVRDAAVDTLGDMRANAQLAIPALSNMLNDSDEMRRFHVAIALGQITTSSNNKTGIAALAAALKAQDTNVRQVVAEALENVDGPAPAALPALINALKDSDSLVRVYVVRALKKLGMSDKTVVDALRQAVASDQDKDVRELAADALESISFTRNVYTFATDPLVWGVGIGLACLLGTFYIYQQKRRLA